MKTRDIIIQIFSFLIFLGLQIMVARNLVLFDKGFTFIYIAFILLLPFETGSVLILFLGFLTGLSLDIFYDSLGIHAASTLLIAFIRPYWIQSITPRGGYDNATAPALNEMGFQWFVSYALPLIFVHHFTLFFIEVGGLSAFWFTIPKVLFSTVLSFVTMVIVQFLFYPQRRSI